MPYLLSNESCGLLTLLDEKGRLASYSRGIPVVSSKYMLKYVGRYLKNLGPCDDEGNLVVEAPVAVPPRFPASNPIQPTLPVNGAPAIEEPAIAAPKAAVPAMTPDAAGLPQLPQVPKAPQIEVPKKKGGWRGGKKGNQQETSQV